MLERVWRKGYPSILLVRMSWCNHYREQYGGFSQNKNIATYSSNPTPKHTAAAAKSFQLCLTLCDPIDRSLPDSSVPGIFQARVLKWVASPFSRGPSQPRDPTCVSCVCCFADDSLPLSRREAHTLVNRLKTW